MPSRYAPRLKPKPDLDLLNQIRLRSECSVYRIHFGLNDHLEHFIEGR